jgi:hypothetical protein
MQGLLGWNLIVSLPAILLVAWLSGRLLGVSRGWAATVVAGLVGWLSALALSLAIAKGDPAAPGFGRNLWVFAVCSRCRRRSGWSCWPGRARSPGPRPAWCRCPGRSGRCAAPVSG